MKQSPWNFLPWNLHKSLSTSQMERNAFFKSLPAFHFCLIWGRGSIPLLWRNIKNTIQIWQQLSTNTKEKYRLETIRKKSTGIWQKGREREKITKGGQCSRRKTLIITLTEQWISPQRLGALIDLIRFLLILLFLSDWFGWICLI